MSTAPSPTHFDLVIIGTGSGNSILDHRFEALNVAIVERGVFGGTCINRGCIPTKMLVHPADLAWSLHDAARLGVDATLDGVRWRDVRDRVFGRIDPIVESGEKYRDGQANVTLLQGDARFIGERRLIVERDDGPLEITGDRIVIAAGGRPTIPEIDGIDDVPYETSDTIMRIDELPRRLIVLGGGFIASELAHVYGAYGVDIVIVTRGDHLISHHDLDVSEAFTEIYRERFELHLSVTATEARMLAGGEVALELSDGSTVQGDMLLLAVGRTPNADQLAVGVGGIGVHDDGRIVTDEHLLTSSPGVWALGDITSEYQLKHVANHEARVVQHNLLFPDDPISTREDAVPHVVFGDPQVASVGLTEAEAREAAAENGTRVGVGFRRYADTAFGWALEDTTSFCKIVVDLETRLILGAHIIGPWASVLIQTLVQGMRFGQTVDELARLPMYPHPALSEVVEQALLEL